MIISLIKVAIITLTMGVGANKPTPINYVEPQKQPINIQANNLTITKQESQLNDFALSGTFTHLGTTRTYDENNYATTKMKYRSSTYNTALGYTCYLYESINYKQLYQTLQNNPTQYSYDVYAHAPKDVDQNSLFWATQITPYKSIAEGTTATITFGTYLSLSFAYNSITWVNSCELHYYVEYLIGNNRDLINYLEYGSYDQTYYQAGVWNTITSANMGFKYQRGHSDYYVTLDQEHHSNVLTIEEEITIDTTTDNFLFVWARPYVDHFNIKPNMPSGTVYYNGLQWTNYDTGHPYTYAEDYIYRNSYNSLGFNGQYLTPIATYEVVDIPGMMFEIISLPFTFISQAFNLTIFPGTPYQVNISNLILTIFGVLVFIFIFKMWLKARG